MMDTTNKQRVARMVIYDKFSASKLSTINCEVDDDNFYVIKVNDSIVYTNINKDDALDFIYKACAAYECLAFLIMDEDFYEMAADCSKLDTMTILGPEHGSVPALFLSGDIKPAQIKQMINDLNRDNPLVVEQDIRRKVKEGKHN